MTSMHRKGTKMSCRLSGMILLNSLYSGPSTPAMSSGGKTCEP